MGSMGSLYRQTWEVARIDADHFIGVVEDIEMKWHAVMGTKGNRWPDPPYIPVNDKEQAKQLALIYYETTALHEEPGFSLRSGTQLRWAEEPLSIWVPFHLSRNRPYPGHP